MRRLLCGAGAACLVAPTILHAAPGDGLSGLKMAMMKGACTQLIVGGKDLTGQCKPSLINNAYRSGRSSFMFGLGEDKMVSFFGVDSQAMGDQAILTVDEIGVATGHSDGTAQRKAHKVKGSCNYTNPYAGPSRIHCAADGFDGHYAVEFVSDGRPPDVVQLP